MSKEKVYTVVWDIVLVALWLVVAVLTVTT